MAITYACIYDYIEIFEFLLKKYKDKFQFENLAIKYNSDKIIQYYDNYKKRILDRIYTLFIFKYKTIYIPFEIQMMEISKYI